ncbi:apoptosis regulatory protein Siva [Aquarana catesbeiana]|uniref:apoptosis regulatory protein Siva n=1 Tax=Aquarana catesbeiana TaxID=8400 RepID=UPI003CC95D5F
MPKRSYPFDSLAPPQIKTRIGQKELSQGVCGESMKREIFEKTKKLLFSGAQAIMGNQSNENQNNVEMDIPAPELLAGQTTIGQDGKLHRASHTSVPAEASKACSSCVRSVGVQETCRLCERYSCRHCSKSCCCCSAVVCAFCRISLENEFGERVYCTSCSVFEM